MYPSFVVYISLKRKINWIDDVARSTLQLDPLADSIKLDAKSVSTCCHASQVMARCFSEQRETTVVLDYLKSKASKRNLTSGKAWKLDRCIDRFENFSGRLSRIETSLKERFPSLVRKKNAVQASPIALAQDPPIQASSFISIVINDLADRVITWLDEKINDSNF